MPEERGQKPEREIIYVPASGYMHQDEDEIDLLELWNILWDRKWFIFGFVALCTAVAAVVSLYVLPPQYKARATLQVNEESKAVITNYLNSNKLIKHMTGQYQLLPKLYPEKWDASENKWLNDQEEVPTLNDLMAGDGLPLQTRSNSNTITVTWKGQDPELCAKMLERAIQQLRVYLENKLVTPEEKQLAIFRDEIQKLNDVIQGGIALASTDTNNQTLLQSISEYMKIKQQMFQFRSQDQLSRQYSVLDEPVTPQSPEKPRPKLIVGLSFVLSLFVAVFLVFFLRFIQSAKQKRMEGRS